MSQRNFGNQLSGTTAVQAPPANNKAVCRFQNDSGVDILVSALWFDWGSTPSMAMKAKAIIYSDSAATPATLLATSNENTAMAQGTNVQFVFPTPLLVTAGSYVWAGIIADMMNISSRCLLTGSILYNTNLYSSGPTNTFGVALTAPYTYRMFLTGEDGTQSFGRRSVDITAIAPGDGNYQPDREHAEKVVLGGSESVIVTSISTYIRNTEAAAKCKAAIYTDSGDAPGTKVAQTSEVIGSTANSWMELPIPSGVLIAPGTYWLAFITDTNLTTPVIPLSGNLALDGPTTEANAWPTTYNKSGPYLRLGGNDGRGIDIYASYTLPAPALISAVHDDNYFLPYM